ncbi:hypothetical protein C2E25_15195 [Geothermobacter hydrogeniphilus]|uniref:Secretin/TonB short N-terminal domain-containing protein n=1 Tax=Geothermobacter hydrogeniphilus TaxID=1969733 RepID=A0A2K2H6G2_9BACT|nr:type IV pilus secretin family protein [Geothermobacter hydrogeniphilus]PNU18906.1 hypothetical protein C2E25_15195 [Geothermobacter hydrogeniphilus]
MIRNSLSTSRSGGQFMRLASLLSVVAGLVLLGASLAAAQTPNKLLAIQSTNVGGAPTITLKTENPVGYRYTVYDSFDPVRVVIDFPGMDVSQVQESIKLSEPNLQEVRVSSFDLESGKLGRVEILLGKTASYEVSLTGNDFNVTFKAPAGKVASIGQKLVKNQDVKTGRKTKKETAAEPVKAAVEPAAAQPDSATEPQAKSPHVPVQTTAVKKSAVSPDGVSFAGPQGQQARFVAPEMKRFQYFRLAGPARLVVDVYGVKPRFKQRSFAAVDGFKRIRVGVYADKTRFVFDAEGSALPGFEVARDGDAVVVDWSGRAVSSSAAEAAPVVQSAVKPSAQGVPVVIEALDFDTRDGRSIFSVKMSGAGQLIPAVQKGDVVQFGVANATINRSLRRVVDASSFPSAVKLITPYLVQNKKGQDVRFAVELKGPVSYTLKRQGTRILFQTDDGAFAEIAPPSPEAVAVPVAAVKSTPSSQELAETVEAVKKADVEKSDKKSVATPVAAPHSNTIIAEPSAQYTGEKISLVFDNADIRQILQLIGEVANLNIIASDEVKGNITLRLLDVPWDQALDLIMDIKDLGMLKTGNVARILPRSRIRSMEEAKLSARRTKEKLQDLVTEVIMVSHASLDNVAGPVSELLTERGKLTPDARNKQIIVTDVPSAIASIKQLVSILDTPERQVLIESRIVEANSNFSRDLGVKWGFSYDNRAGSSAGDSFANLDNASLGLGGSFLLNPTGITGSNSSGLGTSFTFGRLGIDSSVLDLKISALETSGHGKVISQPRIATLNGEAATISQGTKIPYQSVSDQGTETKFENAELKLEVTPVINPDDSVILEISASNSSVGATVPTGVGDAIAIDEKKAETKVLVRDGETTVIGGIFVEDERFSESGVPVLMSMPIVGNLFKSTTKSNERRELLIFVTPRILK